jgi:hypothetical protein
MTDSRIRLSYRRISIIGFSFLGCLAVTWAFLPIVDCPAMDWITELSGVNPLPPELVARHPEALAVAHRDCDICGGKLKITWWAKWRARVALEETLKRQGSPF